MSIRSTTAGSEAGPRRAPAAAALLRRALAAAGVAAVIVGLAAAPATAGKPVVPGKPAVPGTSAATGAAARGQIRPGPAVGPGKSLPSAPPNSPNVTTGKGLAAKPARPSTPSGISPQIAWTVHLSASQTYLWQTRPATLTATANADVGPTPYYIRIFEAGTQIAICGSGTTCSVSWTESTATTDYFTAEISDASRSVVVAIDPPADSLFGLPVTWHATTVTLAASPTTLPVGGFSTLTATTADDVGPSPYYTEIFDATTGTFLHQCGSGTVCSVAVSQGVATTHAYRAYVSLSSGLFPPAGVVTNSADSYVTWTGNGYQLSLSAPAFTFSSVTVTATSSVDVGPTPYYIEIFDDDTGTQLAVCGFGTTCSTSYTPSFTGSHLVAFITTLTSSIQLAGIQASSNVVTTTRQILIT
jgi:hypothetical protein